MGNILRKLNADKAPAQQKAEAKAVAAEPGPPLSQGPAAVEKPDQEIQPEAPGADATSGSKDAPPEPITGADGAAAAAATDPSADSAGEKPALADEEPADPEPAAEPQSDPSAETPEKTDLVPAAPEVPELNSEEPPAEGAEEGGAAEGEKEEAQEAAGSLAQAASDGAEEVGALLQDLALKGSDLIGDLAPAEAAGEARVAETSD